MISLWQLKITFRLSPWPKGYQKLLNEIVSCIFSHDWSVVSFFVGWTWQRSLLLVRKFGSCREDGQHWEVVERQPVKTNWTPAEQTSANHGTGCTSPRWMSCQFDATGLDGAPPSPPIFATCTSSLTVFSLNYEYIKVSLSIETGSGRQQKTISAHKSASTIATDRSRTSLFPSNGSVSRIPIQRYKRRGQRAHWRRKDIWPWSIHGCNGSNIFVVYLFI